VKVFKIDIDHGRTIEKTRKVGLAYSRTRITFCLTVYEENTSGTDGLA
jgi:hypothetical protein